MSEPVAEAAWLRAHYQKCRQRFGARYENFISVPFVPLKNKDHLAATYVFCRIVDDIVDVPRKNDTPEKAAERHEHFRQFRQDFHAALKGERELENPYNWLLQAFADTVRRFEIPLELVECFLDAMHKDCDAALRYPNFEDVLEYCRGAGCMPARMCLAISGRHSEAQCEQVDMLAIALTLVNFWQSIGEDYHQINRIYIPLEDMENFGVTESMLRAPQLPDSLRECIVFQLDRTEKFFQRCDGFSRFKMPEIYILRLIWHNGRFLSKKIRQNNCDTIAQGITLGSIEKFPILFKALFR